MSAFPLRVLRAARALWSRDRTILLPLCGLFLFVPQWAILLLVPEAPAIPPGATDAAALAGWSEQFGAWFTASAPGYFIAALVTQFGTLAIATLYLGPGAGEAGSALKRAVLLFGRFLLAAVLLWMPAILFAAVLVSAGGPALGLAVGPFLYLLLLAVMMLVAPAVAAGPGGAVQAVVRSWTATRGHRAGLFALAAGTTLVVQIGAAVLVGLSHSLRVGGMDNPAVLATVDAGAAAVLAGGATLLGLAGVVAYRALTR